MRPLLRIVPRPWLQSGIATRSLVLTSNQSMSSLAVKLAAQNSAQFLESGFQILFFNVFSFACVGRPPSTILGHWEMTRAFDAFAFVVFRSCAGMRCLTPFVFLKT